jgi:hypothetical protein
MRREKDCRAEIVNFFQYLDDFVSVDGIEVSSRLVSNKDIGLIDDCTCNRDALLFTA